MKVNHHTEVELQAVDMEGAAHTKVRWLLGKNVDAANFAMRLFEIEPGGHTPRHQHDYEHEIFVLEGEGHVLEGRYRPSAQSRAMLCTCIRMMCISFATTAARR